MKSRTCVIENDDAWDGTNKVGEGAKGKTLMVDALAEFSVKPENSIEQITTKKGSCC